MIVPINGLRVTPEQGHSGWFIWLGEGLSEAEDYFKPHHVAHMKRLKAEAVPFMGLGVGWRFLLAPGHMDVWFDETLD